MIHSRDNSFEYVPQFQANAKASSPAKVVIRIMSFNEIEALERIPRENAASELFKALFISCENIVDADGAPLRTAEAILCAPGLKNLILECLHAFRAENGLLEDKKKD